ncbi:MAG: hypothetical protein SPE63_03810, partial [Prevotella sp.]|nr:hypothetical protein [Prevotella sp.]
CRNRGELEHKGLDSAGGTQSKFTGFQSLHNSFVEVTFMSSKMRSLPPTKIYAHQKISENSDMAKSWATFCCSGTYK